MDKKLAILVPYRDRAEHLDRFLNHSVEYLDKHGYDYHIFIIEQSDDSPFNRGKLLNIGFKEVQDNFDYFCFHDIDMLPDDVDYSYCEYPTHLAVELDFNDWELLYPDYFGGVTLFNKEDFEKVNGFSNEYWGWGFEDDDLLIRCKRSGIKLDHKRFGSEHRSVTYYMEFDGEYDYIEIPTESNLKDLFKSDFTISVRALPMDPPIDLNEKFDQFSIICRPGFHTSIGYTSGKEFKAEVWSRDYEIEKLKSSRLGEYLSHCVLKFNSSTGKLSFYVDGEVVDEKTLISEIIDYGTTPFYLGVSDPQSSQYKQAFRGRIYEVAMWDTMLLSDTIKELYEWDYDTLTSNMGLYKESKNLQLYYNFMYINDNTILDLSGNNNNGILKGPQQKKERRSLGGMVVMPHRRNGRFLTMKHDNAGWDDKVNTWTYAETRQNQIRFYNEVKPGMLDFKYDGLSTCEYSILSKKDIHDKVTFLSVEL